MGDAMGYPMVCETSHGQCHGAVPLASTRPVGSAKGGAMGCVVVPWAFMWAVPWDVYAAYRTTHGTFPWRSLWTMRWAIPWYAKRLMGSTMKLFRWLLHVPWALL